MVKTWYAILSWLKRNWWIAALVMVGVVMAFRVFSPSTGVVDITNPDSGPMSGIGTVSVKWHPNQAPRNIKWKLIPNSGSATPQFPIESDKPIAAGDYTLELTHCNPASGQTRTVEVRGEQTTRIRVRCRR